MKIKFYFRQAFQPAVTEIFEFEKGTTTEEIDEVYNEWYYNEINRAGIERFYEEIEE